MAAKKKNILRNCKGHLDDIGHALANSMYDLGFKIDDIASRLNSTWKTIKRAVTSVPPSSRPKRLPPQVLGSKARQISLRRRRIKALAEAKEWKVGPPPSKLVYQKRTFASCSAIAKELKVRFGSVVSKITVRRDLFAIGKVCKRRAVGPSRKEGDPAQRMAFSKTLLRAIKRGELDPSLLVFTDEKWGNTNDHGLPTEWCDRDEDATRKVYDRYATNIHVWGAIGVGVKMLIILPTGNINAEFYISNILKKADRVLRNRVLVQDGAKPHTSAKTTDWLSQHGYDVLLNWPARSCDLNPIENLWALLQKRVSDRLPVSAAELAQYWREEFDAIPQAAIDRYVLSFAGRLERCVQKGGETIATKIGPAAQGW